MEPCSPRLIGRPIKPVDLAYGRWFGYEVAENGRVLGLVQCNL